MSRITPALLIVIVLLTTVMTDADILMPGVRRTSGGSRAVRTPRPLHREDSPIFFPTGGTEGNPSSAVMPPATHGGSTINRRVPGPVLPNTRPALPFNVNELDYGSLNRLNNISNIVDFASLFELALPAPDATAGFSVNERFGGSNEEPGESYEMANCKPELVTVPLDLPVEPNTMFFPTCIRLEQCGGCCFGPLLICRPTITKIVKVKVLKVTSTARDGRANRNRRQNPSSYHVVEAAKHTACECGCRVREEDCNSDLHTYYEGECSCVCKNKDEKDKCEQQNTTKYWDNDSCNCFCRKPLNCGSGEYFSQISCSCERLVARSGVLPPDPSDLPGEHSVSETGHHVPLPSSPRFPEEHPLFSSLVTTTSVPWSFPTSPRRRPKPVRVPLGHA